jgi:hypothetical protein
MALVGSSGGMVLIGFFFFARCANSARCGESPGKHRNALENSRTTREPEGHGPDPIFARKRIN